MPWFSTSTYSGNVNRGMINNTVTDREGGTKGIVAVTSTDRYPVTT